MILNLDPQFKPLKGKEVIFDSFVFHGGEPHIRIKSLENKNKVNITHRINSFNDLGLLCIAVDALKRMNVKRIDVLIPYFPGARQDRVMVEGESLSLKVYTNIINALAIDSITVFDPHSDVTPALLDNCKCIKNHKFIEKILPQLPPDIVLISPDAGASKKVFQLAKYLNIKEVLECGKRRNVATGELTGFHVPKDTLLNKAYLIVDDICDGGGTFLGLASELKNKNAGKLYLAISHGIFSKGLNELANTFDIIYVTDSIRTMSHPKLKQVTLENIINH